jgi:hypothetical protein
MLSVSRTVLSFSFQLSAEEHRNIVASLNRPSVFFTQHFPPSSGPVEVSLFCYLWGLYHYRVLVRPVALTVLFILSVRHHYGVIIIHTVIDWWDSVHIYVLPTSHRDNYCTALYIVSFIIYSVCSTRQYSVIWNQELLNNQHLVQIYTRIIYILRVSIHLLTVEQTTNHLSALWVGGRIYPGDRQIVAHNPHAPNNNNILADDIRYLYSKISANIRYLHATLCWTNRA